ncbi:MAG: urease accessory protein UreE [Pseudomonadota bacterium]
MKRATSVGATDTENTISLTYAARYLRRRALETDQGESFLLDLAEPTDLRHGQALLLDDGSAIRVVAAPEPLAEVRATGQTLARLAWHVGNRHTPCEVREDRLLIQRDHVLEDMLKGLGAEVAHIEAPFQPEGGAYGHGRTHGHSHSHDPHEDPNAHIEGRLHHHHHD